MGDDKNKATNSEKLASLLEFDAAKRPTLTQELFGEVVKEIKEERAKDAKAKAKEQLVKAMQLREQMSKAEKDFNGQKQKMEKELGKVLNQIQGILSGKCPEENQECCEKDEPKEECAH
jgi:hypothetical protein